MKGKQKVEKRRQKAKEQPWTWLVQGRLVLGGEKGRVREEAEKLSAVDQSPGPRHDCRTSVSPWFLPRAQEASPLGLGRVLA